MYNARLHCLQILQAFCVALAIGKERLNIRLMYGTSTGYLPIIYRFDHPFAKEWLEEGKRVDLAIAFLRNKQTNA